MSELSVKSKNGDIYSTFEKNNLTIISRLLNIEEILITKDHETNNQIKKKKKKKRSKTVPIKRI